MRGESEKRIVRVRIPLRVRKRMLVRIRARVSGEQEGLM